MKFRKLRIAWSVVFGVLCVIVIALWVRSYRWVEAIRLSPAPHGGVIQTLAIPGAFGFGTIKFGVPWSFFRMSASEWEQVERKNASKLPSSNWCFRVRNARVNRFFVPCWMALSVVLMTGCIPWLTQRFSLRALLIVMTAVSVALALIVRLSRQWTSMPRNRWYYPRPGWSHDGTTSTTSDFLRSSCPWCRCGDNRLGDCYLAVFPRKQAILWTRLPRPTRIKAAFLRIYSLPRISITSISSEQQHEEA